MHQLYIDLSWLRPRICSIVNCFALRDIAGEDVTSPWSRFRHTWSFNMGLLGVKSSLSSESVVLQSVGCWLKWYSSRLPPIESRLGLSADLVSLSADAVIAWYCLQSFISGAISPCSNEAVSGRLGDSSVIFSLSSVTNEREFLHCPSTLMSSSVAETLPLVMSDPLLSLQALSDFAVSWEFVVEAGCWSRGRRFRRL